MQTVVIYDPGLCQTEMRVLVGNSWGPKKHHGVPIPHGEGGSMRPLLNYFYHLLLLLMMMMTMTANITVIVIYQWHLHWWVNTHFTHRNIFLTLDNTGHSPVRWKARPAATIVKLRVLFVCFVCGCRC